MEQKEWCHRCHILYKINSNFKCQIWNRERIMEVESKIQNSCQFRSCWAPIQIPKRFVTPSESKISFSSQSLFSLLTYMCGYPKRVSHVLGDFLRSKILRGQTVTVTKWFGNCFDVPTELSSSSKFLHSSHFWLITSISKAPMYLQNWTCITFVDYVLAREPHYMCAVIVILM